MPFMRRGDFGDLYVQVKTEVPVYLNKEQNNTFILKTFELNGSLKDGDSLFKMNCVGCHGITARGLVGPDLHSITQRLNDTKIIKQVIEGLTPPMPSFEIDPQNMSNLLTCLLYTSPSPRDS